MIWKNGDDYFRLENTGFRRWHFWPGNLSGNSTQCLLMPASCSMMNTEVKDVVTMNLESDIKVFVLNDGRVSYIMK